jgi:tRNA(adenine34) deaminase
VEWLSGTWRACLEEAWEAYRAGSLPIGAAIVDGAGTIVSRGRNRIFETNGPAGLLFGNPLAHAETNALLAFHRLARDGAGCVLYTTTEPCPLCVGASYMSRVRAIRFGSRDPWAGGTHLVDASPYLSRAGSWIQGPELPQLEGVIMAMQIEAHVRAPRELPPAFYDSWREALPGAVALGEELARSGRLRELRDDGAELDDVLTELSAALEAAS